MAATKPALQFARLPSGARLAWARSGRGPVLVRVAHWLTHVEHEWDSRIWHPWVARLSSFSTLVRYDERGYGFSDAAPTEREGAICLEDLAAVAQQAVPSGPMALLGVSGAAPIALAYAAQHPQRVSRIILLGGYLVGQLAREHNTEATAYFEATLKLMELGWGRNQAEVQQFFTQRLVPEASPAEMDSLNELQRLACNGVQAAAFMRTRARLDVRALAAQVQCPVLVLHAQGDRIVPLSSGRELAASLPRARFEVLSTQNHLPTPGSPAFEHLMTAIQGFLAEDGAAAPPALTPRERQLCAYVAKGLDNAQLAAHLGLSEKTVRNMLSLLYAKLGVEGRSQAVVRTQALGFGQG
jgi:pimeloyl-ACP methyl ester carboxylesterase